MKAVVALSAMFLVLAVTITTSVQGQGLSFGTCNNCGGLFGSNCSYASATQIQTGSYYTLLTSCTKVCNGPYAGATQSCVASVANSSMNQYSLSGSLSAGDFGLSGGWSTQMSTVVGCTFSQSCSGANCCVGPGYVWNVIPYSQKVRWQYNYTKGWWCTPCTSYTMFGILKTQGSTECGTTNHASVEPAPMTAAAYCASNNAP